MPRTLTPRSAPPPAWMLNSVPQYPGYLPLKYYKEPIDVPTRMYFNHAQNMFDHLVRVYVVIRGKILTPDDQFVKQRQYYSYQMSDWHRFMHANELHRWKGGEPLHEKFMRSIAHAAGQGNLGAMRTSLKNYVDFYMFVEPHIQLTYANSPVPGYPYELRNDHINSDRAPYYYYNRYIGRIP